MPCFSQNGTSSLGQKVVSVKQEFAGDGVLGCRGPDSGRLMRLASSQ
jgi:hypothetical protein